MTNEVQTIANRENAQRSTGPNTAAGKANSSRNALRHGILGAVVPANTPGFQETIEGLYRSLRPMDEVQRLLVDQIAVAMVRLQRVTGAEQRFLDAAASKAGSGIREDAAVADKLLSNTILLSLRYETALNRLIHRNLRLFREMKSDCAWQLAREGVCPYLNCELTEEPSPNNEQPMKSQSSEQRDAAQQETAPVGPPCSVPESRAPEGQLAEGPGATTFTSSHRRNFDSTTSHQGTHASHPALTSPGVPTISVQTGFVST